MKPLYELNSYQITGQVVEQNLLAVLQEQMIAPAYVYTVLDYAVALGLYKNPNICIGLGLTREIIPLPLAYVQELRVFNGQTEFRACRNQEIFRWRLRKDQATEPEACGICVLDETHKLWGSIWEEEDRGPWSLLRSKRGSAILFPENIGLHGEKGVKVRNYIQINSSDEEKGLVHFVDERLCDFVDWPDRAEGGK